MPRSLWTGSLSFGLVNVPVQLFSAVRDRQLHFTQLHEKDGAPIETRRFCAKEDEEVPWEEVAHGYEHDKHGHVVLTDEELAAVAPRKTRTIEIDAFVDLRRGRPDAVRPPVPARAGGRHRGHAARLPAARRGDGQDGPRGARALRAAQQGVPRRHPRPRRPPVLDDDAVRRRDCATRRTSPRGAPSARRRRRSRARCS